MHAPALGSRFAACGGPIRLPTRAAARATSGSTRAKAELQDRRLRRRAARRSTTRSAHRAERRRDVACSARASRSRGSTSRGAQARPKACSTTGRARRSAAARTGTRATSRGAADELEAMLRDPNVKDPWAREVAKLARRGAGAASVRDRRRRRRGRSRCRRAGPALVVPCELEGERILALSRRRSAEVIIDSSTRREPAWVNLRFGESHRGEGRPRAHAGSLRALARSSARPSRRSSA